jgi:hypothetical protein
MTLRPMANQRRVERLAARLSGGGLRAEDARHAQRTASRRDVVVECG